ncbi:MAG: transglutaminase-like domain-containing protein [Anaerovoracaceae bacterium]
MKKKIAIILSLLLCVSIFPMEAQAAIKSAGEPAEVESLISSENLEHNFVKVTAMGNTLQVEVETSVKAAEYNYNLVKVGATKGEWAGRVYPTDMGEYNKFSFSLNNTGNKMARALNGDYILMITKKIGAKNNPVIYKNCCFRVTSGQFKILQYDKIIEENARLNSKANKVSVSNFKKTNLSDLKTLVFRDPVTKKVAPVTTKKVKYFKTVSDKVVKGADSDYEKLLKIYEYIAENFYYDNIAFSTGTKQYVDPYRNLYNMRNKKKSANSENGKVATTCVGYAAAVAALARAQGIPTRIVNGHHVSLGEGGFNNWYTEQDITTLDHWWAECYVDGRWITVDATPGNSNKWNRSTNKWTYTGLTNYIYFDPTPEQLATSHMILETKGVK